MDNLRRVTGLPFDDDRMEELLEKYGPMLAEIEKLRTLELKHVFPAVRFDPETAANAGTAVEEEE